MYFVSPHSPEQNPRDRFVLKLRCTFYSLFLGEHDFDEPLWGGWCWVPAHNTCTRAPWV